MAANSATMGELFMSDLAAWRALIERELAGASFEKLVYRTPEDIDIEPLYTERPSDPPIPGEAPYVRGTNLQVTPTELCIRLYGENSVAVEELNGGANVLWIDAYNDGALEAAVVANANLIVEIEKNPPQNSLEWISRSRVGTRVWIGIDPINAVAKGVTQSDSLATQLSEIPTLICTSQKSLPNVRPLRVSTTTFHGAGADAADELALGLSSGVAYLRSLVDGGLSITDAARTLWLQLPVGRDTFGELCKLRAARILWHKVFAASGVPNEPPPPIHAVASARTQALHDPWNNILRVTTEMFAAILGGAQIVTPRPFDDQFVTVSALGHRVARNTVLILRDESHLGRVIDAAGGSFYIENRTDALAREAWKRFTAIEKDGGVAELIKSGDLRARLDAAWTKRLNNLSKRKEPIIGVSEYALIGETLPGDPIPTVSVPAAPALAEHRDAEIFEKLRSRIEGARRDVILLPLGPPSEHRMRNGYSTSLFGIAGIRTRETIQPTSADVAVICGTDERYATEAAGAARALKAAGAKKVALAGRPGPLEAELRTSGVDSFLYLGCNVVETLEELLL
ncbi:MAG TPA: methylmalonyl-CoA mutase family protein [Candidatus Nitrosocosmicus sp.]|nr:methylmalonyl-CoA mutase family protein [Candidatus Nitrosocosmicus sp.]